MKGMGGWQRAKAAIFWIALWALRLRLEIWSWAEEVQEEVDVDGRPCSEGSGLKFEV